MIQVFGGKGFVGSGFVKAHPDCLVNDREDLKVCEKTKQIMYFISTVSNYNVHTNPYIDIETNLLLFMRVLEQCKGKDIIMNYISSWVVYGATEMPATEDSCCKPTGFYSITKRCAEQLLISYCETFNIEYRILRLANVSGFGDKKASSTKNPLQFMINELKLGHDVQVYENGNSYRDYIHIDDAVIAMSIVLEKGPLRSITNIGNGAPIYFKDMITYAKELIGGSGQLIPVVSPDFYKKVQVQSIWMSNAKLIQLGYSQQFDYKYMVMDMIFGDTCVPTRPI